MCQECEEAKQEKDVIEVKYAGRLIESKSIDPWANRTGGMRCSTCVWFVLKYPTKPIARVDVGRCRRHSPTMNGYPVVKVDDWCGDHRLDENK